MSLRVRIFWSLVIPLAALALQWALWDLLKPYVWFLFYPAVFFASLLTGLAGGIAATFLSALIVWYFFIPPQLSFAITGTSNLLAILIFSVTGTAFSVVARRLRQLNRKQAESETKGEQSELLKLMSSMTHTGGWTFDSVTGAGTWTDEVALVHDLPPGAPINVSEGLDYYIGIHREIMARAVGKPLNSRSPMTWRSKSRQRQGGGSGSEQSVSPLSRMARQSSCKAPCRTLLNASGRKRRFRNRKFSIDCSPKMPPTGSSGLSRTPGSAMYRRPAPEEFLADPDLMARIVHPDDRATYVAHVANVVCHDDIDLELRIVRADGDVRWISHHCVPIHDTDGRLLGRQGTNHHITERKQSEAVAKRSEAIVQSSEDAIISKTLDGIVTSWNPGAEAIFGFGNGEMIGKTKLALFPPELLNEETAILERIRGGETVEHIETQRLRKDGKRIDVSVTISPIRDDVGNVVGASKIARDITERKLQNIALIASERRFHDIVSASGDSA